MTSKRLVRLCAAAALLPLSSTLLAAAPAGDAASFEIGFMKLAIDHHFAALRMTELAAGTDVARDAPIRPQEGTAPTEGFEATPPRATLADLQSMARKENRAQREEILALQAFLKDWYGIFHRPQLRADGQQMIAMLEAAQPGADFNRTFFEQMSRHHFAFLAPLNGCLAATDLEHYDLRRKCLGMWQAQVLEIDTMRVELKKHYGVEDYRPF